VGDGLDGDDAVGLGPLALAETRGHKRHGVFHSSIRNAMHRCVIARPEIHLADPARGPTVKVGKPEPQPRGGGSRP
jgi:hypothetical protein